MKKPVGVRFEEELIERIRNAAYWIGQDVSFNSIVEDGARALLEAMEAQHNGGKPFRPRTGQLPGSPLARKE